MKKKVIIPIVIVAALALIGAGVYLSLNSKDKVVFSRVLTKFVENIETSTESGFDNFIPKSFQVDVDKLKMNTDTSLSVTQNDVTQKAALKGELYINQTKNKVYGNASLVVNNETLAKVEALFENTKMHAKIQDVTKGFYYNEVDMDLSTVEEGLSKEDTSKVATYLKEAILDNLKDSDFTSEKKTIELDGKDYDTKKITLNITEKKLLEIMRTFFKKVEKDDNLKKALEKVLTADNSSTNFNEALKELDDEINTASDEILFTYELYVYGKDEAVKQVITVAAEEEANVVIMTLNSYENKNGFNNYELTVGTKDQSYFTATVKGTSKTKSDVKVDIMAMFVLSGTYEITDKSATLDINITVMNQECGSIKYTLNTVTENKEYEMNLEATIDVETFKLTISSANKIYLGEEMPEVDVTGSKPVEEISEEEQNKLMELMEEIEEKLALGSSNSI